MKRKIICILITSMFLLTGISTVSSIEILSDKDKYLCSSDSTSLSGYVYGDLLGENVPVENAWILEPTLNITARTDNNGYYFMDFENYLGLVTVNVIYARYKNHDCYSDGKEIELVSGFNSLDFLLGISNSIPELTNKVGNFGDDDYEYHSYVNTDVGDSRTYFTFSVHYYDQDGDIPVKKNVVIDDMEYEMRTYPNDDPTNGFYWLAINGFSMGEHYFHFNFDDGFGGNTIHPEEDLTFEIFEDGWYPYLEAVSLPESGKVDDTFEFIVHYSDTIHQRSPEIFCLKINIDDYTVREFKLVSGTGPSYDADYKFSSKFDVGEYEYYIEAWIDIDPSDDSKLCYVVRLPPGQEKWSFGVEEKSKNRANYNRLSFLVEQYPYLFKLIANLLKL
jgi:hypothetical protein